MAGINGLTKYMTLELLTTLLMLGILIPMAARILKIGYPKGLISNAVEAVCLFIKDNAVVRRSARKMPIGISPISGLYSSSS